MRVLLPEKQNDPVRVGGIDWMAGDSGQGHALVAVPSFRIVGLRELLLPPGVERRPICPHYGDCIPDWRRTWYIGTDFSSNIPVVVRPMSWCATALSGWLEQIEGDMNAWAGLAPYALKGEDKPKGWPTNNLWEIVKLAAKYGCGVSVDHGAYDCMWTCRHPNKATYGRGGRRYGFHAWLADNPQAKPITMREALELLAAERNEELSPSHQKEGEAVAEKSE